MEEQNWLKRIQDGAMPSALLASEVENPKSKNYMMIIAGLNSPTFFWDA